MKYTVSIAIDGRIDINVEADNVEDAKNKAYAAFMDADVGEIEIIGSNAVNATDENNNLTDY